MVKAILLGISMILVAYLLGILSDYYRLILNTNAPAREWHLYQPSMLSFLLFGSSCTLLNIYGTREFKSSKPLTWQNVFSISLSASSIILSLILTSIYQDWFLMIPIILPIGLLAYTLYMCTPRKKTQ